MPAIALTILLSLIQATQTGIVVGIVKIPGTSSPAQAARTALLPGKYTEIWNKQVQTRLDNYWELFKPEFAANKNHFLDFDRMAQLEAFRFITSTLRRELGDEASRYLKESSASGQFEFTVVPFGTYQLLVQAVINGQEVIWSKTVEVQTTIPTFVDLGKPVS